MTSLERKLKATLKRLRLDSASAVLVGVSGGADSMALLDAMQRLTRRGAWQGKLYGGHVNHLLRGAESDEDERFVQTGFPEIPVAVTRVDVAAETLASAGNLEAVARRVRYDFFRSCAADYSIPLVFTAHTYDDQVETLLMRWMRGTGAKGLRGIRLERELGPGVRLVRPLLDVTRAEVLEYCAHYGLKFRTDSSNLLTDFTRNRVRQELLPLLQTFNPQIGAALLRGAAHWQADAECLDELAKKLWQRVGQSETLPLAELAAAPQALRHRVLQMWLEVRINLREVAARHWQALEWLVCQSQSGRTIELPQGWRLTREFDTLRLWQTGELMPQAPTELVPGQAQVFGNYEVELFSPMEMAAAELARAPYLKAKSALLSVKAAGPTLWLRTRQAGDAYVPEGRERPVKLKTLLIRGRIPLGQRPHHPLLMKGEEILWSPGLPVARAYSCTGTQERCVLVIARERCNLSAGAGVISKGTDA